MNKKISNNHTKQPGLCVVVSHYNARPSDELYKLLYQLKDLSYQHNPLFSTSVIVVVNCASAEPKITLPADLSEVIVQHRENTGFNIGSWDHGWRNNRQYKHFIFLQDECEIACPDALHRYWSLLESNPNVLLGESMFFYFGWQRFKRDWPESFRVINNLSNRFKINLGLTPSHLQTLILAASNDTLARLDGFIYSNDKIEAIATEVLLSRKALSIGIIVKQASWLPFSFFKHPQWSEIRVKSRKIKWSLSKALWLLLFGIRELGSVKFQKYTQYR